MKVRHPGSLVENELKSKGVTQKSLAEKIGVKPSFLNELIKGRRSITVKTALMLEGGLGISAELLLETQMKYTLSKERLKIKTRNKT